MIFRFFHNLRITVFNYTEILHFDLDLFYTVGKLEIKKHKRKFFNVTQHEVGLRDNEIIGSGRPTKSTEQLCLFLNEIGWPSSSSVLFDSSFDFHSIFSNWWLVWCVDFDQKIWMQYRRQPLRTKYFCTSGCPYSHHNVISEKLHWHFQSVVVFTSAYQ